MTRRAWISAIVAAALALLWSPRARAAEAEYQVKAEFMERFTRFIDWPATSFPKETDPFAVCLAGKHPFGDYLDKMAKARQMKKRRMVVRAVTEPAQVDGCHILFIAGSEAKRLPQFLERTGSRPILTVGDTAGFGKQGILINFYRDGENVRFEINVEAATRSGLRFNSKLIRLGKLVGGRS